MTTEVLSHIMRVLKKLEELNIPKPIKNRMRSFITKVSILTCGKSVYSVSFLFFIHFVKTIAVRATEWLSFCIKDLLNFE